MAPKARSCVAAVHHPHGTRQRAEIVPQSAQGGAKRSGFRSVERPRDQLIVRVLNQHRCGYAKQRHRFLSKVFVDHRLAFIRTPSGGRTGKSISSFHWRPDPRRQFSSPYSFTGKLPGGEHGPSQ